MIIILKDVGLRTLNWKHMNQYNVETIKKNIFHELNKMLVALTKDDGSAINHPLFHKLTNPNAMLKYYLKFSLKVRSDMAKKLAISEKTLHRFYEDPIKLLDNHKAVMNLSIFLSHSYPHIIELFFSDSMKQSFKNRNESIIMKEIIKLEEQRNVEERREIARVVHLILSLDIPARSFSEINLKMINKKFYNNESVKRINNFLDNF